MAEKIESKILSKVNIFNPSEMSFAHEIVQNTASKPLWKWFVVLALLFLIGEIFIEKI